MTEIKQYYAQYFRYHFELDNDEVSQQELVSELGMHRKEVVVEFVCPHCRKCHTLRELYVSTNFTDPGRVFECGAHVTVAMAWTPVPAVAEREA